MNWHDRGDPGHPDGANDLGMRVSRHARNAMRARGWSVNDIGEVIASEDGWISRDDHGNIMVVGCVSGQRATVVLANDGLDFVITIYGERGRQR